MTTDQPAEVECFYCLGEGVTGESREQCPVCLGERTLTSERSR